MMPSEFKEKWQYFQRELIFDAFEGEVLEKPEELRRRLKEMFEKVNQFIDEKINGFILTFASILVKDPSPNMINTLSSHLMIVLKLFSNDIFSSQSSYEDLNNHLNLNDQH